MENKTFLTVGLYFKFLIGVFEKHTLTYFFFPLYISKVDISRSVTA